QVPHPEEVHRDQGRQLAAHPPADAGPSDRIAQRGGARPTAIHRPSSAYDHRTMPATASEDQAKLLERDGELAQLSGAVEMARDGFGQLVVVEGPAGIGKSKLLGAARDMARDA